MTDLLNTLFYFSIWLLGYMIEFSYLYIQQGHCLISTQSSTDEEVSFYFDRKSTFKNTTHTSLGFSLPKLNKLKAAMWHRYMRANDMYRNRAASQCVWPRHVSWWIIVVHEGDLPQNRPSFNYLVNHHISRVMHDTDELLNILYTPTYGCSHF